MVDRRQYAHHGAVGGRVRRGPAARLAVAVALLGGVLGACGGDGKDAAPVLGWYVNPDNGSYVRLAAACTEAAGGRYRLQVSTLPTSADGQREQLVRRLAAEDRSIALMSLDPPFVAEFAAAGFLRPFTAAEAEEMTDGVLAGPVEAATWDGRLAAAPFLANTQLLWYRRSVAARAGLDPSAGPVTWDQVIGAAERTGTTMEVQGARYEGYMVLISNLIASAGGQVLAHPEHGRDAEPVIDSRAGRRAAEVIGRLGRSPAANPALSVTDEEAARAGFQGGRGGFMTNWPYVYGAATEAVADGSLDRSVFDDIGWARWPRVDAGRPSEPPLGGIALGVGAFTPHEAEALDAVRCLTSADSQRRYMLDSKNPAARTTVYDDPEVRSLFPMADLIRESINDAAPRPKTPYYTDLSAAVVRTFHPPRAVDPARTPAAADRLVADVLHDRVLL